MDEPAEAKIRTSRMKFSVLVMIAFVPIMIAYIAFFYLPAWIPAGTTNNGQLITPPIDAGQISPELSVVGTWMLLLPIGSQCDAECTQLLYLSRQVIAGLGKDTPRINRAVLANTALTPEFEALLAREHPGVSVITVDTSILHAVDSKNLSLFLMDPNGNVLMYYHLDQADKPMYRDLKHLLKISKIG